MLLIFYVFSMTHNILRCDKCKDFRFSFLATLPMLQMHFLKRFPPCSNRPRISTSYQRLPLLTWRSHSSNSFPNLTGWHALSKKKNRPRQGKSVKIQTKINWSRGIRPKVKRAKLTVWNSSSFWPPPCAVCKNGNVCHTAHRTRWIAHLNWKNIPNMTHSPRSDGEKLIEIERVKMWEAPCHPLHASDSSVIYAHPLPPPPRTSIMFATFWAAPARGHTRVLFLAHACLDFCVNLFHISFRWFPVK